MDVQPLPTNGCTTATNQCMYNHYQPMDVQPLPTNACTTATNQWMYNHYQPMDVQPLPTNACTTTTNQCMYYQPMYVQPLPTNACTTAIISVFKLILHAVLYIGCVEHYAIFPSRYDYWRRIVKKHHDEWWHELWHADSIILSIIISPSCPFCISRSVNGKLFNTSK